MPGFVPLPFAHFDWRNPDLEPCRTASAPYEMLSPLDRATLAAQSPYNMVHIDLPGSAVQANRILGDWLDQGAVVRREQAYYILSTQFFVQAAPERPVIRWSIFGGLRLSSWGTGGISPLERASLGTGESDHLEPLRAIRATRAQLAPIFGVFDDPSLDLCAMGAEVEAMFNPLAVFRESEVIHRLWRLPGRYEEAVAASFAGRPVFIADGVLRYEAALAYQAERGAGGGRNPWDWVFACLSNLALPGVAVLPCHRVILPLLPRSSLESALSKAGERFSVSVVQSLDPLDACPHEAAFVLERGGVKTLLAPRAMGAFDALNAVGSTDAADSDFLQGCLSLSDADMAAGAYLKHTPWVAEARQALANGEALAALFVKAMPIERIRARLGKGQTLPRHATYFYPKTPTGLLLYLFR